MNCKFCNAELPEEETLCPQCGKDNSEEASEVTEETVADMIEILDQQPEDAELPEDDEDEEYDEDEDDEDDEDDQEDKPKRNIWVTILAVIGGITLAAVLVGAVIFGMKAGKLAASSYTVSAAKAERKRDTVIAVVGDRELTNSELQLYYWQGINEFYSYMGYYMDTASMGLDLNQPLDKQFYDAENGVTWQQYFVDMALNTWHRYAAMAELAESEGFALDADSVAYLATVPQELEAMAKAYGYGSAADMLREDMGPACDMAGYQRYVELNFFVGNYFNTLAGKLAPTQDEMDAYYTEHEAELNAQGIVKDGSRYVDARHILFCPTGGTLDEETGELVYSDAEWEACRQQAQMVLDQWKSGAADEDYFAELAATHTQDPGSQSTGGLYTDIYTGQMVEPFEEWCFDESRAYGDTGLVRTDYGYHVMFFVESREAWISQLSETMASERSTALVNSTVENTPMKVYNNKIVLCDPVEEEPATETTVPAITVATN